MYRGDAHRAQRVICLLPYHRYLPDGERIEEGEDLLLRHLPLTVGLRLSGSNLRDGLVDRQPDGDGQPRLPYDSVTQLMRPAGTTVESLHPGEINVVLIHRRLLIERRLVGDDVSHHP